jgi:hypothetical protein
LETWHGLVCEHGGFWLSRAAAGELQIRNIVRADDSVEDVKDVLWYRISIDNELVVMDEAFTFPSYQTHSLQVR